MVVDFFELFPENFSIFLKLHHHSAAATTIQTFSWSSQHTLTYQSAVCVMSAVCVNNNDHTVAAAAINMHVA